MEIDATATDLDISDPLEANLELARQAALTAHDVVIRLKEMGLPDELNKELAALSTDLGDLWGAQKTLEHQLQRLLDSDGEWESVGDNLVDLRTTIDHIKLHAKSVRGPISDLAAFAYDQASGGDDDD